MLDSSIFSNTLVVWYYDPPTLISYIISCIHPLISAHKTSNLFLSYSISATIAIWGGILVNFGVNFIAYYGYAVLAYLSISSGPYLKIYRRPETIPLDHHLTCAFIYFKGFHYPELLINGIMDERRIFISLSTSFSRTPLLDPNNVLYPL